MDPYLEQASGWAAVNSRVLNAISEDLADRVAPAFFVTIEERIYLVDPHEPEVRDRYLEIWDAQNRDVVTTIEILSPRNKAPGTPGREAFLRKRAAVMASTAHWIEIDLLRGGERPPEIRGRSEYYALLKRGGSQHPFEVWFSDLRDRLPTIAVPLRTPVPDVPLDLHAALALIYRRGHYGEMLSYDGLVPPPPLSPADLQWATERIAAWHMDRQDAS
jgi:hypothetical protein